MPRDLFSPKQHGDPGAERLDRAAGASVASIRHILPSGGVIHVTDQLGSV
jgi:hypothetical protein